MGWCSRSGAYGRDLRTVDQAGSLGQRRAILMKVPPCCGELLTEPYGRIDFGRLGRQLEHDWPGADRPTLLTRPPAELDGSAVWEVAHDQKQIVAERRRREDGHILIGARHGF